LPNKDRRNLTLRVSSDEGATWTVVKVLEPEAAAYSDLAIRRDGTVLCHYETKSSAGVAVLRLARVDAGKRASQR
jgi:sialidase-1